MSLAAIFLTIPVFFSLTGFGCLINYVVLAAFLFLSTSKYLLHLPSNLWIRWVCSLERWVFFGNIFFWLFRHWLGLEIEASQFWRWFQYHWAKTHWWVRTLTPQFSVTMMKKVEINFLPLDCQHSNTLEPEYTCLDFGQNLHWFQLSKHYSQEELRKWFVFLLKLIVFFFSLGTLSRDVAFEEINLWPSKTYG